MKNLVSDYASPSIIVTLKFSQGHFQAHINLVHI